MANKKAKGKRAKQRDTMKRRERTTVNKMLADIKDGQTVQVNINSRIHAGLPFRRFQGKTGVVSGKRGRSYVIKLRDGNKAKQLIVHPAHLKELKMVSGESNVE
ncbi:MAG: 50S ribosomal protein L21e [archaeon]